MNKRQTESLGNFTSNLETKTANIWDSIRDLFGKIEDRIGYKDPSDENDSEELKVLSECQKSMLDFLTAGKKATDKMEKIDSNVWEYFDSKWS